ncbi:uncharacterized protein LY89DRAFT_210876 [Mollisia scopiformis]|uniref:Uncharacterized protein n=1 Tax=Mollisia scopiformis TaxID=149040 RepID=A0A194WYC8_MOLSC|nr:uncharacterized protein LY89DRAFT_210876 [Mollisia scopiformis]KUJ12612.1 hypothetical protein LY89DRAFT_210876 [Mollisia scopiformis]
MANASSCWFPDGQTNGASGSPEFVPCNPSAAQSACCAVGETCVGNNLCLSGNGLMYRGGCTDKTFSNGACPSLCTDDTGRNAGPQDSWIFMKPCDASTGKLQWVCDLAADCTNSSLRFDLIVGGPQEVNITGTLSTSSSTTSPTTSTSSSLPSSSSTNDCTSKRTSSVAIDGVGAGVGASLGVLFLLALVWGFWERRKRIMTPSIQQQQQQQQDYSTITATENKYPIPQEAPDNVVRSELAPMPPQYVVRNELA